MTEDELKKIEQRANRTLKLVLSYYQQIEPGIMQAIQNDIPALIAALRESWVELQGWRYATRSMELPSGSIVSAPGYILDEPNAPAVFEKLDEAFREQIAEKEREEAQTRLRLLYDVYYAAVPVHRAIFPDEDERSNGVPELPPSIVAGATDLGEAIEEYEGWERGSIARDLYLSAVIEKGVYRDGKQSETT